MSVSTPVTTRVGALVELAAQRLVGFLARRSIDILRVSLGVVFLGFAIPKYFPGVSPAESLVVRTLDALSFGLVAPEAAMLLTAVMESVIGVILISGRALGVGLLILAGAMVGIMSPVVLFAGEMFAAGPTLEAQYVLKDVVLVAAALVVAAKALGAQLVPPTNP